MRIWKMNDVIKILLPALLYFTLFALWSFH